MKMLKVIIPVAAVLLFAGQAAAQTDEDKRLQAEEERARAMEARELEMEEKLRLAEERMAAAAREIAELTEERLPRMIEIEKRFAMSNKPMLGVTIETTDKDAPVEGVTLAGVTPGGAAADAGLRSGDILTSVNNEALNADSGKAANGRLLDFMKGVEEGDVLTVEYLRDGKVGKVEIEPRVMSGNRFVWMDKDGGPQSFDFHVAPPAPGALQELKMAMGFPWVHTALGKLELVELNEGLGRYFGADKGLLVVKAPDSEAVDIRDGDVIQSIDGREPKDTRHAMRILGSYQPGEKLKLGIMRDKKKKTIDIEIPADHQGNLNDGFEFENSFEFKVRPAMAPAPAGPPLAPRPDEDVIIVDVTS